MQHEHLSFFQYVQVVEEFHSTNFHNKDIEMSLGFDGEMINIVYPKEWCGTAEWSESQTTL